MIDFTDEEILLMKRASMFHDDSLLVSTNVDHDNLFQVCLRLIDLDCATKFREDHGFEEGFQDKIIQYLKENAMTEVPLDSVPLLGVFSGAFDFLIDEE